LFENVVIDFIGNRYNVFKRKEAGLPKPWTNDKILQSYRFCNVHREADTVSKWVMNNIVEPHKEHSTLAFNVIIARLINWPDTLQKLGYIEFWDPAYFIEVLHNIEDNGEKVFGSAYIVSTNGIRMGKAAYLANKVLTPIWEKLTFYSPNRYDTLEEYNYRLSKARGMGSFMAAQVVADLKHVWPLFKTLDWWTFAASGPGSRRGLNRVLGQPTNKAWKEREWKHNLVELSKIVDPCMEKLKIPRLDLQNLQNCLCEFDKYERTRLGEGRPRSTYPGV